MERVLHYKYALVKDHSTPHVKEVPGFTYAYMTDKLKQTDTSYRDLFEPVYHFPNIRNFAEFSRKNQIKLIHAHYGQLGIKLLRYVEGTGVPLVVSFRGKDITSYPRKKENRRKLTELFNQAELLLPVCSYFADRLIHLGCPKEKIRVLYGGVDLRKFAFQHRSEPPAGNPIRLLTIGRFTEKKGFTYLLQAFAKIHSQHPSTELRMIGRRGEVSDEVKRLVNHLGLKRKVKIKEYLDHDKIAEELQKAHIFCLPSITAANGDMEGIPNVLKEAMAAGLPVVSTKHAGIPELIEHGKEGFLADERDVNGLTAMLEKLIVQPKQWKQLAVRGREKVEKNFNLQKQLALQAQFYEEARSSFLSRSRS
ncbi:glycosyltransferase [Ammoniphilus sp. YIM 78166]|uniref:glycosyltransferase n=1 Tax=Ammoniphilus sp. YIM 78166 TaxID=1644106 RepID=UPI00106FC9FD|nr:glycosyltransferase [Ammoniphilus sp. YIM 78166]